MGDLHDFSKWLILQMRIGGLRIKLIFQIALIIVEESARYVAWQFVRAFNWMRKRYLRASTKLKLFILGRSLAMWSYFHGKNCNGWPARVSESIYNALEQRYSPSDK